MQIILDTGCSKNIISKEFVQNVLQERIKQSQNVQTLRTAGGHIINPIGEIEVIVKFGNSKETCKTLIIEDLPKPLILGTTFLKNNKAMIDFGESMVHLKETSIHFQNQHVHTNTSFTALDDGEPRTYKLKCAKDYILRPNIEIKIKLEVDTPNLENIALEEYDFEEEDEYLRRKGIIITQYPLIQRRKKNIC